MVRVYEIQFIIIAHMDNHIREKLYALINLSELVKDEIINKRNSMTSDQQTRVHSEIELQYDIQDKLISNSWINTLQSEKFISDGVTRKNNSRDQKESRDESDEIYNLISN